MPKQNLNKLFAKNKDDKFAGKHKSKEIHNEQYFNFLAKIA